MRTHSILRNEARILAWPAVAGAGTCFCWVVLYRWRPLPTKEFINPE